MSECPTSGQFSSNGLPPRHFLRDKQKNALVFRIRSTEETTKLRQHPRFLTRGSEQLGIGIPFRQSQLLGWLFAIIKQLIHGDFERASKFLKCLHSGNRMSVFHARNVATQQSRSLFNVTL